MYVCVYVYIIARLRSPHRPPCGNIVAPPCGVSPCGIILIPPCGCLGLPRGAVHPCGILGHASGSHQPPPVCPLPPLPPPPPLRYLRSPLFRYLFCRLPCPQVSPPTVSTATLASRSTPPALRYPLPLYYISVCVYRVNPRTFATFQTCEHLAICLSLSVLIARVNPALPHPQVSPPAVSSATLAGRTSQAAPGAIMAELARRDVTLDDTHFHLVGNGQMVIKSRIYIFVDIYVDRSKYTFRLWRSLRSAMLRLTRPTSTSSAMARWCALVVCKPLLTEYSSLDLDLHLCTYVSYGRV